MPRKMYVHLPLATTKLDLSTGLELQLSTCKKANTKKYECKYIFMGKELME